MKTIGAGIIAIEKQEGKVLLGRRGLKCDNPNCWVPFGGTFELKDEFPRRTAFREFLEETGCQDKFMLGKKPFFIQEDNHLRFYTYIGIFDCPFIPELNSENLEFGWFDIDLLPENLHPGFLKLLQEKKDELKELCRFVTF